MILKNQPLIVDDHLQRPVTANPSIFIAALAFAVLAHVLILSRIHAPIAPAAQTTTFEVNIASKPRLNAITTLAPTSEAIAHPETSVKPKETNSIDRTLTPFPPLQPIKKNEVPIKPGKLDKSATRPTLKPAVQAEPQVASEISIEKPRLNAEDLLQQIHSIGERESSRFIQHNVRDSRIKFANAVSQQKYLVEQYVKDWDSKVERTGNLNYPEAARHVKDQQTLTMDIGISADGSIYSMRIVRSSGNPALDEAAKRIVKMSAPFAELPVELLKEVDVLVISRVWKFSDETGMTTH